MHRGESSVVVTFGLGAKGVASGSSGTLPVKIISRALGKAGLAPSGEERERAVANLSRASSWSLVSRSGSWKEGAKTEALPKFPTKFDLASKISRLRFNLNSAMLRGMANLSPVKLSTKGRAMPPITPQTLGTYFDKPVGEWNVQLAERSAAVTANVGRLGGCRADERLQLHKEINLHWNAACEVEKAEVLEALGTKELCHLGARVGEERAPARDWLEHKLLTMSEKQSDRLWQALSSTAQANLGPCFSARARKAELMPRFKDFRCDLAVDHLYPYVDLLDKTGMKLGELPPEKRNMEVVINGGGAAGILTAYLLQRAGFTPIVLEQADAIGGRQREIRIQSAGAGPDTKSALFRPGFMRIAPTAPWAWLAKVWTKQETLPFKNARETTTLFLVGDRRPVVAEPGQRTTDDLFNQVEDEYNRVMDAFLAPLRQAREAGDTAAVQEFWKAARDKFDSHTYRSGLEMLLNRMDIKWSEEKWNVFGTRGTGVGGYRGYFPRGFLSVVRFLADKRLEDHEFMPAGSDRVLHALLDDRASLPEGWPSLGEQRAIRTNAEYLSKRKERDGSWTVTYLDKVTGRTMDTNVPAVVMALPIPVLRRLNETAPDKISHFRSEEITAIETVNIDDAAKVMWPIPKERLEGKQIAMNIQASKMFAQVYVIPPNDESPDHYQIHAYPLGANAWRTHGYTAKDHIDGFIGTLKGYKGNSPEDQMARLMGELLEPVDMSDVRLTNWGDDRNFGGAFKMSAPYDQEHVDALWNMTLRPADPTILYAGDELTEEDGFSAGTIYTAVHATLNLLKANGAALPANSPLDQELLFR
jgi:tryptophan 2-monooxygenase